MISEKELQELLSRVHPVERPRIRALIYQLNQKVYQLEQRDSECRGNLYGREYKSKVLEDLAKQLGSYDRELISNPIFREEVEKKRKQIITEMNAYESNIKKLTPEIKELTEEVKKLNEELKPYLEKARADLKKLTKPLILIIVSLSVAYLIFSGFQSVTGYSVLPEFNLTKAMLGLIFLLVMITFSLRYFK